MKLDESILADRRHAPAAQFSMRTLLVSFPSKKKVSSSGGVERFLEHQGAAVLAHEWVHFLQATSASTGIVGFVGFLETLQMKLALLSNILGDKKDKVIRTPIVHSEQNLSADTQILLSSYLSQYTADTLRFAYADPQLPDGAEFTYTDLPPGSSLDLM